MPISDYLRTLREKVGQDPILMPSASTVVRDDHGRLLLARHSDGDLWVLPGGALDPGESPADTAIRETWEETGLLVEPLRILGVYSGPDFALTYANGDTVLYVIIVFEAKVMGGHLQPDGEEVVELEFVQPDQFGDKSCARWMRIILEDILSPKTTTLFQPASWKPK